MAEKVDYKKLMEDGLKLLEKHEDWSLVTDSSVIIFKEKKTGHLYLVQEDKQFHHINPEQMFTGKRKLMRLTYHQTEFMSGD